jgi:membrane protein
MSLIRLKEFVLCFYHALVDTVDHDGVEHAGYLAFLGLLSFFPFLVFFVAMAGALGESDVGLHLMNLMLHNNLIPEKVVATLTPRIDEIVSGPPQGLLTLAIVGAIWTASSAVEGLRTILNRAYRVHTPPAYIFRRLLSIAQFLLLTAVLMIAMLVLIFFPLLWEVISPYFPGARLWEDYWSNLRFALTGFLMLLVVSCTYYILPNIRQRWRAVMPGAFVVVIGWMIAGTIFSAYLRHFNQVNLIYGSLGGIIVSLLFLYIFGMILVYGAEFNYHISRLLGERVEARE